jgi:hypothetical protein
MSVLITAGVLLALALWAIGVYRRLVQLRAQVTRRWREVHALRKRRQEDAAGAAPAADEAGALEHAERAYTLVAGRYNAAIAAFPGNVLAGIAGFKSAEPIDAANARTAGG